MKRELLRRIESTPEEARVKLRNARERLGLRFRDVEEASQVIAQRYGNDEFAIHISRLSAFENEGTVPNIYKLYSLCAIYRLDFADVVGWYGVDLTQSGTDVFALRPPQTHMLGLDIPAGAEAMLPIVLDPGFDSRKTSFLSRQVQRWGTLPLLLLQGFDNKNARYGYVGEEDFWMHPLIQPGSLLIVDEAKRRIERGPWPGLTERPIFFVQTHDGEYCTWLSPEVDQLVLVPHPQSGYAPRAYSVDVVEVIGQVVAVATRLDQTRRSRGRL